MALTRLTQHLAVPWLVSELTTADAMDPVISAKGLVFR